MQGGKQVNRTDLRGNQAKYLGEARGTNVLEVVDRDDPDRKIIIDKRYFDELRTKLRAAIETLEITRNPKLFRQLLEASVTLEKELKRGKLRSLEVALGKE
jgi:hypothetical protein